MSPELQAVRAAIIKAVPEIVELKFGCEVLLLRQTKKSTLLNFSEKDRYVEVFRNKDGSTLHGDMEIVSQILGRPIRLSDVLVTLEKENPRYPVVVTQEGYLVGTYRGNMGSCANPFNFKGWYETTQIWNLRQDDLSKQSPECIHFLHTLLAEK